MADKKTPQEASNIFHSIIKASVTPGRVKCPICGADAKRVKGNEYEWTNGHTF